jgi:hypothetical protein
VKTGEHDSECDNRVLYNLGGFVRHKPCTVHLQDDNIFVKCGLCGSDFVCAWFSAAAALSQFEG